VINEIKIPITYVDGESLAINTILADRKGEKTGEKTHKVKKKPAQKPCHKRKSASFATTW